MRKIYFILVLNLLTAKAKAQSAESILDEFKSINKGLVNIPCSTGKGNIIANRAMNIFLSNKVGTYLSGDEDLSLYKNSITFNTTKGAFAISHNMRQAKGTDEPVKSFLLIGARANILNSLASSFNDRHFINDFGMLVKKVWMGKTHTYFKPCNTADRTFVSNKQLMDAERYLILSFMETEIKKQQLQFENGLSKMDSADAPDQNLDAAKSIQQKNYYTNLKETANRKFAELQSETLIATNNYTLVATHWTSIGGYVPLLREGFYVAPSFTGNFQKEHLYPFELFITHTRFWESSKSGRFFLKLNTKIFGNNSYHSEALKKVSIVDYKAGGGNDTNYLSSRNLNEVLIGRYNTFFTPMISGSLVFIPKGSHVGISFLVEQHFGKYRALNGTIGLPVVLIDKRGDPALTFEFQVNFFDISNTVQPAIKLQDKTSIGFSIGVPFSKIVY